MHAPRTLTIGAVSDQTGVNIETIRYYERIGLVPAPARSANNRRAYGADDVRRLRFIKRARQLGFSLGEARALIGLDDGADPCAETRDLAEKNREKVRRSIEDLTRLEHRLTALIAGCDEGRPGCAILESLSN